MSKKFNVHKLRRRADIGSRDWWDVTPIYQPRGLIESCLRLLEQGEIDRAQALALIEYSLWKMGEAPAVPWHKLQWD